MFLIVALVLSRFYNVKLNEVGSIISWITNSIISFLKPYVNIFLFFIF